MDFVSNIWKNTFNKNQEQSSTEPKDTSSTEHNQDHEPRKPSSTIEEVAKLPEDEEVLPEAASHKAMDSAKTLGNFLYSVANKAGQTVSATAKQLKHTVEQNSFLADFTKEQQDFVKEHGGNIQVGDPPWLNTENEEEVKQQILSLSQDKRNFVRSPPVGVTFDCDLKTQLPIALSILKHDENLNKMRFEIVPKLVNEETFWKNYFYRISLIKQSTQISSMEKCKGWGSSSSSSAEGPDDPSPTNPDTEFLSDNVYGDVSAEDLEKGMRQLGVGNAKKKDDKQYEDEINKELQEFEVVGNDINNSDEAELEKDLADLL